MSYSGDAAEQVVRMTLEGTQFALKITGNGAERIAKLLYSVLRDQKKTRGRTRLTGLLRSGKELKVFNVKDENLAQFCKEAKRYGVLYCVLKDRHSNLSTTDVMIRADDSSKVNRIFERFHFADVDVSSIRTEIQHEMARDGSGPEAQEQAPPAKSKEDIFLDALLSGGGETPDPPEARTERSDPSGLFSERSDTEDTDERTARGGRRRSVREELREIAEEHRKSGRREKTHEPILHEDPAKKRRKVKER